jgi:hypothetical protein
MHCGVGGVHQSSTFLFLEVWRVGWVLEYAAGLFFALLFSKGEDYRSFTPSRVGLIVFLSFLLLKGRYITPVLPSLFATSGRAKQMINKLS